MGLLNRFFTSPQVWALQVEREPGTIEVVTETLPEGEAPVCFLSPVDAHIEGLLRAKPGLRYYLVDTSFAHESYFRRSNGLLVALLHLAWVGHSGRMMLRPSGKPFRYLRTCVEEANGSGPLTFELDVGTLDVVDRLYEQAGLFAWRETSYWESSSAAGMQMPELERHREIANLAVRSARAVKLPEVRAREELILFDPEFLQWHAVARIAVETE